MRKMATKTSDHPHEVMKNLPDQHLYAIYTFITGFENMTETELSKPILRPALQDTYFLFVIQYAILSILGMLTNIWIIYYITRHKLYRDNTHAFFINLSVCHFVQSAFVVPVTLVVIIVHNWILGQFMCYFVPMLQVSILILWLRNCRNYMKCYEIMKNIDKKKTLQALIIPCDCMLRRFDLFSTFHCIDFISFD